MTVSVAASSPNLYHPGVAPAPAMERPSGMATLNNVCVTKKQLQVTSKGFQLLGKGQFPNAILWLWISSGEMDLEPHPRQTVAWQLPKREQALHLKGRCLKGRFRSIPEANLPFLRTLPLFEGLCMCLQVSWIPFLIILEQVNLYP